MKALKWLRGWRSAAPVAPVRPAVAAAKDAPRVNWLGLIAKVLTETESATKQAARKIEPYRPAPGVVPKTAEKRVFAMDATPYDYLAQQQGYFGYSVENTFPGYPYLAQLAQLPEYRKITCTIAKEMTRKWLKLRSEGEGDDKAEKLQKLESAMVRFKVRQAFRRMAEHDGFFGRGQLYIDIRKPGGASAREDENELRTPLIISPAKIKKGSLDGFRVIEPVWMYPGLYNSTQPLAGDFYRPSTWYVMGKIVHASRFVIMMARPVPDLLKAAYSFGGVSLSQLARPYVDNWLRTRDSVSDLVHNFSITGLATDMQAALLAPNLEGDQGQGLINRMKFFNAVRDNRGLMLTDKEKEEFFQFNTPLSGLDQLQAQAQEQMAAVSSIPLVKLLGITPAGLNANSDGEIRVFYDDIHAEQENSFRDEFKKILDVLQLNEFGEIDPDITFEFEPLYQLSSLEKANEDKIRSETDQIRIDSSVISSEEARARVANDPESPYTSLEVTDEDDLDQDDIGEEGDEADRADTQRQGAPAG